MTTVFKPSSKIMIEEYNELKTIPQFSNLTDQELRFVWYFSNPTSPFIGEDAIKRLNLSLDNSFGRDAEKSLIKQYDDPKTRPEKINNAIERMANIDVSARVKAKILLNTMFSNLCNIVTIDYNINDTSQAKNYVELCAKVSRELPHIIKLNEEGFGVEVEPEEIEEEEPETRETPKIGDRIHGLKNVT